MSNAAAADEAIRRGSQSFALASRLFDPITRRRVWDLYAWCRHCDDVVDGQSLGHDRHVVQDGAARLAEVRAASHAALRGEAPVAGPFAALARVVAATDLPAVLLDHHLDGFQRDVDGVPCETLDDTLRYSYHVAGVVGLMMAWVMGVRQREVLCRASDLGVAFQLTNIARDVGDDLAAGRIYLPAAWLHDAGITMAEGTTLDAATAARLVPVVHRLLGEADRYYDSAWYGLAHLPLRAAWAVATARTVYRDIGGVVERRGAEAWTRRASTGTPRKIARLLGGAATAARTRFGAGPGPPRTGLFTPPAADMLR